MTAIMTVKPLAPLKDSFLLGKRWCLRTLDVDGEEQTALHHWFNAADKNRTG